MSISISRREPMIEEYPLRAAMQASSSFGSSSRTWFSTGISNNGFATDMCRNASEESITPPCPG